MKHSEISMKEWIIFVCDFFWSNGIRGSGEEWRR
jgi:hypothetical protein